MTTVIVSTLVSIVVFKTLTVSLKRSNRSGLVKIDKIINKMMNKG